jgi:hypothetical protein
MTKKLLKKGDIVTIIGTLSFSEGQNVVTKVIKEAILGEISEVEMTRLDDNNFIYFYKVRFPVWGESLRIPAGIITGPLTSKEVFVEYSNLIEKIWQAQLRLGF